MVLKLEVGQPIEEGKKIVPAHQQNFFLDEDGIERAMGVVLNNHGDVTSRWYMDNYHNRIWLIESKLIHVATRPARPKQGAPKAVVWGYPKTTNEYCITFDAEGEVIDTVIFALDAKKAWHKALYWAAKKFDINLAHLYNYVNDGRHLTYVKQIEK